MLDASNQIAEVEIKPFYHGTYRKKPQEQFASVFLTISPDDTSSSYSTRHLAVKTFLIVTIQMFHLSLLQTPTTSFRWAQLMLRRYTGESCPLQRMQSSSPLLQAAAGTERPTAPAGPSSSRTSPASQDTLQRGFGAFAALLSSGSLQQATLHLPSLNRTLFSSGLHEIITKYKSLVLTTF